MVIGSPALALHEVCAERHAHNPDMKAMERSTRFFILSILNDGK